MSSGASQEDIVRLLTTFKLELSAVPAHLKCAKCKLVMKVACQVPCGCRYCRACIDDLMTRGAHFCTGGSQDCARAALAAAQPDYGTNNRISRLVAKCPHEGCYHEFPLAKLDGHLRVCLRQSVDCPYRELGCLDGKFSSTEIDWHLQQEGRSHSEMLAGRLAGMGKELAAFRRELAMRDERVARAEGEIKAARSESKRVKSEHKATKYEVKATQDKNKAVRDEVKSAREENALLRERVESITRDKEALAAQLSQLSTQLEREIKDRRDCQEELMTQAEYCVIDASEPDQFDTRIEALKSEVRQVRWELQSARVPAGLAQGGGACDKWLLEDHFGRTRSTWHGGDRVRVVTGAGRPYTYRLSISNRSGVGACLVEMRVLPGPEDARLDWPCRGVVTVLVACRDRTDTSMSLTRQCCFERPPHNLYSNSEEFLFPHNAIEAAGMDLELGVSVWCQIRPGAGP